jgi:2-methylisocitrate lyase-like PEP mutase family enzyme
MTQLSQMRKAFRARTGEPRPLVIPGTGDPLGGRLIRNAGFEAAYMSGFAVEGTHAFPDVGLLGMSEIVRRAADIAEACELPLVCDADTGYGGLLNVRRTVREFERAGVAAIQLEDQELPKKCGSMAGKRIVPVEEMTSKIRAAVDARTDPDLLVIARTDAMPLEGLDRAIERMQAYAEAGADLTMMHGNYKREAVPRIAQASPRPFVYLNSESLTMPMIPPQELAAMGVFISVFPLSLLLAATRAMERTLAQIRDHGSTLDVMEETMTGWSRFNDMADLPKLQAFESTFAPRG